MNNRPRWEQCIHHHSKDAENFVRDFFAQPERSALIVGGAGFDPRSCFVVEQFSRVCRNRVSGLFIREERPNPAEQLCQLAEANITRLQELISNLDIFSVNVFGIDNAPVGGRRVTQEINKRINLDGITDLILDCSALSIGIMFPVARYCYETVKKCDRRINFHIFVLDAPSTDSTIQATSCGKATPLHTFSGGLNLDDNINAARLWLPQLGTGRKDVLNLVYQEVTPHAVCPIIPFPATNPQTGDALIAEYGSLFETISGSMTGTWHVDSRDLVYAHEKRPLDLYRSILRIDDARKRVFSDTGGSILILSPLGSKAVAVGILMAALERDFAVVSVESIEYDYTPEVDVHAQNNDASELVHIWLHGEAYRYDR